MITTQLLHFKMALFCDNETFGNNGWRCLWDIFRPFRLPHPGCVSLYNGKFSETTIKTCLNYNKPISIL